MSKPKMIILALAVCVAALGVHRVHARSMPPLGTTAIGANWPCAVSSNGNIFNLCGAGIVYDVALQMESTGTKTIEIFGRRLTEDLRCYAAAMSPGGALTFTPVGVISSTSYSTMTLSLPVMVAKSSVIAECWLPASAGATWIGLNYF